MKQSKYAFNEWEFPKGIWNFVIYARGEYPHVPIETGHGYDSAQEAVVEAYERILQLEAKHA